MESERSTITLEKIAAPVGRPFAMGPFGSNIKAENYVQYGVPVIRGVNLNDCGEIPFNDFGYVYLTDAKASELRSSTAHPGEIVFVAQGSVGRVGLIPQSSGFEKFILSQNMMKVTIDPSLASPRYVYYYFRSHLGQHEIMAYVNPTGVPCISKPLTSLRSFKVILPTTLSNQHAIAHILGSLDDKIELNRKMNRTLEAMARAIFKSWFVDFDPVRAKAKGSDPNLPKEIADLFPDSFQYPDLREIPKGWEIKIIGEVVEFAYGKALKASNRKLGNVPVFGSNGPVGLHNEALVKGPGIIIGRKGNPGIVTWSSKDFFPIDTTFYVKQTGSIKSLNYLFYALKDQDLPSFSADSAVPGLNRFIAYMISILVPSD